MNIYLLELPGQCKYDQYDAIVVAAESEEKARLIFPTPYGHLIPEWWKVKDKIGYWDTPENLKVTLLGTALEGSREGNILSSFIAG